jgi:uncharacterized protein YjbJ (UPF0337 family)
MNNDHVKGVAEKGLGKIKEAAGHITGNRKLELEGKVDQVKGSVHNAVGNARDLAKKAFRRT